MSLKIDLKIFVFIILFYFTRQIKIYSLMMLFCIIHEFGHLISRTNTWNETSKI